MTALSHDALLADDTAATSDWLTKKIGRAIDLHGNFVDSVSRRKKYSGQNATVTILDLGWRHDSMSLPRSICLKVAGPVIHPLSDREVRVYNECSREPACCLPQSFHAAYDSVEGRYELLIEDLSLTHYTTPVGLPPTLEESKLIVAALANFHAHSWNHPDVLGRVDTANLEYRVNRFVGHAESRFPNAVHVLGDRISQSQVEAASAIFKNLRESILRRFHSGSHLTRVHGDSHGRNFMIPKSKKKDGVRIIDWYAPEWMWEDWIGPSDLAYLMVRYWLTSRRQEFEFHILEYYFERLIASGVANYSWDAFQHDYRLSVAMNVCTALHEAANTSPSNWYPQLIRALDAHGEHGGQQAGFCIT